MATIGRGQRCQCWEADDEGEECAGAWGTVHLALLPSNEDRAKAVVD